MSYVSEANEEPLLEYPHNESLDAKFVMGYNGEEANRNLFWNEQEGWVLYTTKDKLVQERLQTKEQTVIYTGASHISTLAVSDDKSMLALGHGTSNTPESAQIIVFTIDPNGLINEETRLSFHETGVAQLAFSNDNTQLISTEVSTKGHGQQMIAVWNLEEGSLISSAQFEGHINDITVFADSTELIFATVGYNQFKLWKIDYEDGSNDLLFLDISPPEQDQDLISCTYTPKLPAPYNQSLILIGDSLGNVILFNPLTNTFQAKVDSVSKGAIGLIEVSDRAILIGDDQGNFIQSKIVEGQNLFIEEGISIENESPIVALSFDRRSNEGLMGLMNGEMYYVNWQDQAKVRVSTSHVNGAAQGVSFINGGRDAFPLFLTGGENGVLKLWTSKTCDLLLQYQISKDAITCIESHPTEKVAVIGTADSKLHFLNMRTLANMGYIFVKEGNVTCLNFSNCGQTLIIGTTQGEIATISTTDWNSISTFNYQTLTRLPTGIQSIEFSPLEQELKFLMSGSDGMVRVYLHKPGYLIEIDEFDIFKDPHGLNDDDSAVDVNPYEGMEHNTVARWSTWDKDVYLCVADSLQYVFVCNITTPEVAKRINLTLFPTCLEMNQASDGEWAVGSKAGTVIFKHIEEETPIHYNGQQNVAAMNFSQNGDKLLVSGHSEVMMFDL